MDALERLTIESHCQRLMNRFSWAIDAMDYEEVVSLFVPDCVFGRAETYYHGYDGLRRSLEGRPRDRTTRHIVSNVIIDVADADHAKGKAYCLVFGHRGVLAAGAEAPLGAPDSLILHEADFLKTDEGWRFKRFYIGLSFRKPQG